MSPTRRRFGAGLLTVLLLFGSARVVFAQCVHDEENDTYTWNDPGGWSSTINATDGTYRVVDPDWGVYQETSLGGGQYEHSFLCSGQCEGEFSDNNANDAGHQITAFQYINEGNFENGCAPGA